MNRNAKKQDIAEKVKEIKLRQKNWMKQRAESQETKETASPTRDSAGPSKASPQLAAVAKKDTCSSQSSSLNNLLSSHKSNAKFQNWLKAKETQECADYSDDTTLQDSQVYHGGKVYDSKNYTNNLYSDKSYRDHKGSGEANVLRVPSTRPAGYATPDTEWNSEDETGEITTAELMSPQDFDSRADDIIARVKGDLGLPGRGHHTSSTADRLASKNNAINQSVRHSHVGTGGYHKSSAAEMTNHTCPTCEKLMVPPSNSPMLLIPCGHTLCGQCSSAVKFCGLCGCAVHSITANIMLEQIITKYSAKRAEETRKAAAKSVDKNRYREEYQNLLTRQEILHEESNSVKKSIQNLTKKLSREHEHVENILEEERSIQMKIKGLQDRLRVLVEHRGEYEQTCESLHTQTQQEKNKLVLIKDSMRSIDEQMEKVRLFVEEGL